MGTNKIISTDNTLKLKVLSFSSQIPGYEKIKISARKMEMSPEEIDDARIWEGLERPPSPPGLYAHGNIHGLFQSTLSKADTDNSEYDVYFWLSINLPVEPFKANAQMEVINHFRFNLAIIKPTNNSTEKNMRTEIYEILYFM